VGEQIDMLGKVWIDKWEAGVDTLVTRGAVGHVR